VSVLFVGIFIMTDGIPVSPAPTSEDPPRCGVRPSIADSLLVTDLTERDVRALVAGTVTAWSEAGGPLRWECLP
jgi:hypothetical protein